MRKISYNFLFVVMVMTLGLATTAFADAKKEVINKIPKNMSMISVTTDEPMTVLVDGVEVGRTEGSQIKFERAVTPGVHEVTIKSPDGKEFTKSYTFTKNVRNCVCLKTVRNDVKTPCPYNINVSGPDKVTEGDLVTFAAINAVSGGAAALNYVWRVSPENARITSGLGTPSITVDTTGLGGQPVRAEVEVTDGVYDATCRQSIAVSTLVDKIPVVEQPKSYRFDDWEATAFDDDKARLDAFATELLNKPDSQGYIIMYQGTDKRSTKVNSVDKLSKRTLNYLVQSRGVPPNRLVITNWGQKAKTSYDVWIVPPGANPPVPQ